MKRVFQTLPWIILFVPFAALTLFYNLLAEQVLLYRNFDGEIRLAPKSLFTVFRVPLIETVCALMIATARRKSTASDSEADRVYRRILTALLFTVAFKSFFQALEFLSLSAFGAPLYASVFLFATIAVVACGIIFVLFKGRKVLSNARKPNWKLSRTETAFLVFLFFTYIALAFLPMLIYK